MKDKLMPPIILTLICVIVSGLLVLAYNVTYVDNTGVMTDQLKKSSEEIFGKSDYEIMTKEDSEGKKTVITYGKVINVIKDKNNADRVIFEVKTDGYAKDGIDVLVGLDKDGKVQGVSVVALGETPGLGTKVSDKDFLKKFKDKKSADEINEVDGISGATYSSKGVKNAIKEALTQFGKNKEAIFNEQ